MFCTYWELIMILLRGSAKPYKNTNVTYLIMILRMLSNIQLA